MSAELSRRRSEYSAITFSRACRAKRLRLTSQAKRRGAAVLLLGLTILMVIIAAPSLWTAFFSGTNCGQSSPSVSSTSQRRVALFDQLSLDNPNPDFVRSVNASSRQAGYSLDYYLPSTAGLDSFFGLPGERYSIIILRTHGVAFGLTGKSYIVTSDTYNPNCRVADQLNDRLGVVDVDGHQYFAITPTGIENMRGRFPGTIILAMFCSGGTWTSLAKAFIDKGARAYIGWNNTVTATHTDSAFEKLVSLLLNGDPASAAIQEVMRTFGPDPVSGAKLTYYQN